MNADNPDADRKARIDAVLLKLPGASAKKIGGMDAYVVGDRMFACISGKGVGLRLPVAVATELQFSRGNVGPFQPGGVTSTREIRVSHANWLNDERILENIPVIDVSEKNDWSQVKFWNPTTGAYGQVYQAYGFVYRNPTAPNA